MVDIKRNDASVARYELEIDINASPETTWKALIENIGDWWLPDFHMVDPDSTVTFDPRPGGHLVETLPSGEGLLWFTVHWINPRQHTIYLVGHIAPDWGGPATSNLKLSIEPAEHGCVFRAADAHHGHINEDNLASLDSGWRLLFTDGLKKWAESAGG